ncbi:MAG: dethiobiotin synthase [Deltaproteobacteria bacterium]|nr:dethiobiotin synthase [Deltaproteobacteria bacterium]
MSSITVPDQPSLAPADSPRGLFITGTDTGVGKTLFTGALAAALVRRGLRVAVMKPVETGCPLRAAPPAGNVSSEEAAALARLARLAGPPPAGLLAQLSPDQLEPQDALFLLRASGSSAPLELVNPYRFAPAVAPSVAARAAGTPLDPAHLRACFLALARDADLVLVEGAGGLLVPLTDELLVADLARLFTLPVVVVGRSTLGTLNHTLLTVEALRSRELPLAGVVLNRLVEPRSAEEAANPAEIERLAGPVVRGVLPYFSPAQRDDFEFLAQRCRVHVDLPALLLAAGFPPAGPH